MGLYFTIRFLFFNLFFLFQYLTILGPKLFILPEDTLVFLQQGFPLYSNPNFPYSAQDTDCV